MLVVAGLSLKNLHPRVWDATSPYFLPELRAVMVSYGEFHRMPARRQQALQEGLHAYLGAGPDITIYLDNGAFSFLREGGAVSADDYEAFVQAAGPDWYAIPQDYIPTPHMTDEQQQRCLEATMRANRAYSHDGYVPVIHVGRRLGEYLEQLKADERLRAKPTVGLGAMVPNLLRAPRAMPYEDILANMLSVRTDLAGQQLHVFGIGGTATLHLAALLGVDSVDSSGWRNRAARGIVQLPGRGDRMVANMGSWRGREPSTDEQKVLAGCTCPACGRFGASGLQASGLTGFCNRATHNLWVLLQEARAIEAHLDSGTYGDWYARHLDNTVYLPLIQKTLALRPPVSSRAETVAFAHVERKSR